MIFDFEGICQDDFAEILTHVLGQNVSPRMARLAMVSANLTGAIFSDPVKLAWLAGLIEGEGCFSINEKPSGQGGYPTFRVQVKMTDEDVLRKAFLVSGMGRFSGPHQPQVKDRGHKPQWSWQVHKMDHVYCLCKIIRPHMGERRSSKIDRIIEITETYQPPHWRHGTREGYGRYECRCSRCRAANAEHARNMRAKRKTIAGYAGLADQVVDNPIANP